MLEADDERGHGKDDSRAYEERHGERFDPAGHLLADAHEAVAEILEPDRLTVVVDCFDHERWRGVSDCVELKAASTPGEAVGVARSRVWRSLRPDERSEVPPLASAGGRCASENAEEAATRDAHEERG